MGEQPCYTIIHPGEHFSPPNEQQLKHDLEHGDNKIKAQTLKTIIMMILNGDRLPNLLMTIIRFTLPSNDHAIKKLLLIVWEVWPKTTPDGKLLHEMILVCDAYRKDLQHPNEFVRGSTLRFLCKLKEPELLEPLMPSIRNCLEHRHGYVRRNAVLAIYTIYKNFEQLIPDAPELIQSFLEGEQDPSCKRNAFMMLIHVDRDRALDYLTGCIDQVSDFNDILQLVIVELVYKVCYANPNERPRFIRCIYNLLNSTSAAVRYEAAGTLVTLSSSPTAIKAAAQCYIELIVKESDNNVKLIVLDRWTALKEFSTHRKVLEDLVMDILRVLSMADLEVRKKTLELVLDLITSKNIDEVVMILKKEVTSSSGNGEGGRGGDEADVSSYRQALVRTLHACSVKFATVAPSVVPLLLEFLCDSDDKTAESVLVFVREAVERSPDLKPAIVSRLLDIFSTIQSVEVHRSTLWILGEYCTDMTDITKLVAAIRTSLGEIPIVDSEIRKQAGEDEEGSFDDDDKSKSSRLVTADGTYISQSALSTAAVKKDEKIPPLRGYLLDGNFFISGVLAGTLTKLAIRYLDQQTEPRSCNAFVAEAMLIMASVLHLGRSGIPKKPITEDDNERISTCLKVLAERNKFINSVFDVRSREALAAMLSARQNEKEEKEESQKVETHADDGIVYEMLSGKDDIVGENKFDASLLQATGIGGVGGSQGQQGSLVSASKLNKVVQLTGFSDPVYAETYVNVNQYDIVLDVLIVNQTADTLQGLSLELATLGDLKLVERPGSVTIGPHDFVNIKASIKVSSTENGIIFGNIVYDIVGSTSDRNCVILNNIHIDIMDYIQPANCTDNEFRKMWMEFEWENKINLNTNITDLNEFLDHILAKTNMKSLTPRQALLGDCCFLAANLYARSIFGEDALANVSIEKPFGSGPETPVQGHVRIRAKTQGMALSLGDKITACQKRSTS
ncbi:PREDICTED: coatomer subunit beta-like [Amphimedon queenslandica]|uniref:Coatomer subunit beta n=1 Tax=Amphimedon queenslandica TaxID=400682 RepID=A0A1X7VA21_AMPQE|nr:PREDICTED: coatomer subunit beta-like [Amphimedon queenslandica]|eukprot:XP_019850006.1 PREDICTED: coatomer subunit beta-like [Amphimedon queenslandica]